eukprot:COSAG05_NODE_8405_length_706_cov_1.952224_1_plen_202_part_10
MTSACKTRKTGKFSLLHSAACCPARPLLLPRRGRASFAARDGVPMRQLVVAACLLLLVVVGPPPAEAKKKKPKKSKASKCTACVRMVTSARTSMGSIREGLEGLRENKLETGRGADRVYNKRFTKTYDVELMHHAEQLLEKTCAQPALMEDLGLVRSCRTLRDDSADEFLELLLHHEEADGNRFCTELEACGDEDEAAATSA